MLSARLRGWQRPAGDSPLPPFETFAFQWHFPFPQLAALVQSHCGGRGSGRLGRWGTLTSVSRGAMH